MKTILRAQHNRARKGIVKKTILSFVFVAVILLLNFFGLQPLQPAVQFVAVPFWKIQTNVTERVSDFRDLVQSKRALVQENKELKQKINEAQPYELQVVALQNENNKLKHLLGRDREQESILAAVLSRPGVSPYDTFVIDVGSIDGVHVGNEVIGLGDFLVGFISSVERKSSVVTLFSAPGQKTNIMIGPENIETVAQGFGAGNFRAQLSRDAEISVGDSIVISNFALQIFGEVESIAKTETNAFQTILFKSPVSVFSLRWVEVIKN